MKQGLQYDQCMRRCLQLAEMAGRAGDAPVGAVIVRDGVILAEAFEQVRSPLDVAGHAEILAIRQACRELGSINLEGCTLCTNVEPCWMCSFAIRETGISRVVIGRPVTDVGGATSRYPLLTDPEIDGWGAPPTVEWAPIPSLAADESSA